MRDNDSNVDRYDDDVDRQDRDNERHDPDADRHETATDRVDDDTYHPNPSESGKWVSALIAVLGLWMVGQAVLFDIVLTQVWNDILVGGLLVAVGGYNYSQRADEETGNVAAAGIAALLGLWLIAAPFLLGAAEGAAFETVNELAFWNDIAVGLLVFLLGVYSAYRARDLRDDAPRSETAR